MKSWYRIRARASGAAGSRTEVLIYDEIGAYGVTAKGFLAELGALPDDAALDLRLNSPGGSVFDAVAIFNALKRHAGEITVWIDGIAASAASYIAMAGDTVVMPENAFLMIHDPSGLVMGTAEDMRATAEALDKVKGSLIQGYAAKSGKPDDEIAALMAAETWLDAKDAFDLGLIDRIAAPVKLAAAFEVTRFRNAPPNLVEAVAETVGDDDGFDRAGRPDADAGEADGSDREDGNPNIPSGFSTATIDDPSQAPPQSTEVGVSAGNTQPVPGAPGSTVAATNAAPDARAIRAEAIAHARAVIDLCRLAGQPQMAGRFLEEETSLEAVRAQLLEMRAETTPDITGTHAQPGRGAATNPWGEVIARTFRQTKG